MSEAIVQTTTKPLRYNLSKQPWKRYCFLNRAQTAQWQQCKVNLTLAGGKIIWKRRSVANSHRNCVSSPLTVTMFTVQPKKRNAIQIFSNIRRGLEFLGNSLFFSRQCNCKELPLKTKKTFENVFNQLVKQVRKIGQIFSHAARISSSWWKSMSK